MSSIFGQFLRVSTFGESHGKAVGVVVDGPPAGLDLDEALIQKDLDRRRPGTSKYVSPRGELDQVEILSGTADGKTLGTPVAMLVWNKDVRSKDYSDIREKFRPGHADYTYFKKYGVTPQPGGGRSSGRETVGRVAAGAVARALLAGEGVSIRACTVAVGNVSAKRIDSEFAEGHVLRFADPDLADEALAVVDAARADKDSVGGVIQVTATGVPAGLGDPVFGKLDGVLAMAMMSIGAVKGVEIGDGFALAAMRGSQANDPIRESGFESNRAGGILGGISSGQDIIVKLAVKPTPSIGHPQKTVNIHGRDCEIKTHGRHDPCICPRICPVAEAMASLTLADALLSHRARL